MAYLGNDLQVAFPSYRNIDDISGSFNGVTTSFPLTVDGVAPIPAPINSQQCLISVNGVVQRPDDSGTEGFRLSGGNIIFASAPAGGVDFFGVILAGADYVNVGANFPSGTAAAPSITFDSDLDTGIYNPAGNQIGFSTAGTQRLVINSTGQISSGLGTAAAPAFSFISDPNTGIYSPGADQVALSTNGTGRLFVDANGRVHIGTTTSAHSYIQTIYGSTTGNRGAGTVYQNAATGTDASNGFLVGNSNGSDAYVWNYENANTIFATNGSERLRITSAGLVGVGVSAPSAVLHAASTGAGIQEVQWLRNGQSVAADVGSALVFTGTTNDNGLARISGAFAGAATTDGAYMAFSTRAVTTGALTERVRITAAGLVGIGTSSPSFALDVVGDTRTSNKFYGDKLVSYTISNGSSVQLIPRNAVGTEVVALHAAVSGNVGIGTTSPGEHLTIAGTSQDVARIKTTAVNAKLYFEASGTTANNYIQGTGNELLVVTNGGERARIDSSGRVLVGTSSARSVAGVSGGLQVTGTGSSASFNLTRFTNDSVPPLLQLGKSRGTTDGSYTIVADNDQLGSISFSGADGTDLNTRAAQIECRVDGTPGANDMPGRLVFSTTADGASSPTERMRISQNGVVTIKNGAVAEIDTLTDGATITPDFAAGCNFTVTLGGNRTIANPSNLTAGQSGSIFLVQDATGSRTVSWGSYWDFPGGTAPTLSTAANAVDRIDYIVRSSTSIHTVFTANYS